MYLFLSFFVSVDNFTQRPGSYVNVTCCSVIVNIKCSAMAIRKFKSAFQGNRQALSETLHVDLDLLNRLHDKKLLTDFELESLEVSEENHVKVHKLLKILGRRDNSLFNVFCSVLIDGGQGAVVKIIRPDAERTPPGHDETLQATLQDQNNQHVLAGCSGRDQQTRQDQNDQHVSAGCSERDEQTTELKQTLEVDYGSTGCTVQEQSVNIFSMRTNCTASP